VNPDGEATVKAAMAQAPFGGVFNPKLDVAREFRRGRWSAFLLDRSDRGVFFLFLFWGGFWGSVYVQRGWGAGPAALAGKTVKSQPLEALAGAGRWFIPTALDFLSEGALRGLGFEQKETERGLVHGRKRQGFMILRG